MPRLSQIAAAQGAPALTEPRDVARVPSPTRARTVGSERWLRHRCRPRPACAARCLPAVALSPASVDLVSPLS
jgi:hypothetical protein